MASSEDEEALLREVALQTAKSILNARQRSEEEVVRAKEALEVKTLELAHSLAMMRATLESTTDAILVTDGAGRVTNFNEKFVEMWKVPRAILSAGEHGPLMKVAAGLFADPHAFLGRIRDIYASSPSESYDLLELAEGRFIERFSRIQFVDDRNAGRVWTFRDITARRQDERRLRSVAEALQESDRRKDEFLALLAHELRNPLAPLLNAVQVLKAKSPAIPELRWATEVLARQLHQMTRLVDDLLDVSRIKTGKIQLQKKPVDLETIVKSAVEACRPLLEEAGHELTVTLPPEPIHLDGDVTRLSQVLLNLLNNAVKYTDPGGRIQLEARREGDRVAIRVRDTGIGIAPEMLPKIFDMFTQVNHSLERTRGGLGAGLTLVRWLVEMHGGTVHATSEGPGKGSEFVVSLPVLAALPDRSSAPGGGADEKLTTTGKLRILVVDDNKDAAESLSRLLGILGNDVRTAEDGLAAVEAAETFQPDLVLLDIGLPKLNGYDAARRIRDLRGDKVVLVAVTGWGQDSDRRRSKEAGFDHHLTKPVELKTLRELLVSPDPGASDPRS